MISPKRAVTAIFVSAFIATAFPVPPLRADVLEQGRPLKIQNKVPQKAYAFTLRDVRLLDSPFKKAMDLDVKYLMSLDMDRLLSRFRQFAGIKAKAPEYAGWESQTISGHTLGHYLTALAKLYEATSDERVRDRISYIVDELAVCQKAWGNGFVGGFPRAKEVFDEIKAGNIRTAGFDLNGLWVPWYVQHKLYMGLIDAYYATGNEKIKPILLGSTDWAWGVVGGLTDEQFEKMLNCEHGGINEAFAEIYALTGYERALRLAERFYHHRILDPLAQKKDILTGIHGNTNFPKLIGLARLYQLTGKPAYYAAAAFFWEKVVNDRTYATGGDTDEEYFFPPEDFSKHLSTHTTESCNTYNMLKLTRQIFALDPKADCFDFYERALYNHILGMQDPEQGMFTYFTPLRAGGFKVYCTPFDSFWCCTGSNMENHVKYGDSIYYYDDQSLFVNLFIPSVLHFKKRGLTVIQQTRYPEDGAVKLQFFTDTPVKMAVKIRRPKWAADPVAVEINGRPFAVSAPAGEYIVLDRTWRQGDEIRIALPMKLRTESLPNAPRTVAYFYGSLLLAGGLGKEGLENLSPWTKTRVDYDQIPIPPVPVIVGADDAIDSYIRPAAEPATFLLEGGVLRTPGKVTTASIKLIPFYKMHFERYAVYWDRFSDEEWRKIKKDYEAEQAKLRALEARTVDAVQLGEMQLEREHNLTSEKSRVGDMQSVKWRGADDGGWFAFDMKVGDGPLEMQCSFWGGDRDRVFEILVDDAKIAAETINANSPGKTYDVVYKLPAELLKGKSKVRVKFLVPAGKRGGRVAACRVLRPASL
jgi:uncharacterized protein